MKVLKLHQNGRPVYVNAENILTYTFHQVNNNVILITSSKVHPRLEVDETLKDIDDQFTMGKLNTDEKGE